ncbi:hypothetical protein BHE74_00056778 [Ensete ventricosum]|nr:hypothetical protein GW17_00039369 [Ensete ventricosum]RWW38031.1 hypothetical protein BHE74_00056778 [Ensete ventricosum]RZR95845.1 hypothetical protein BHM03_00024737 [Ensete ventricosum]
MQKYRSHRKHLLAREAEAASWSRRRQVHPTGRGVKRVGVNPWLASTIGFLPPPPPPPVQPFRPLHVWGHPTPEAPVVHMWPGYLSARSRSPTPPWAPPQPPLPPPPDPSYWHHLYQTVQHPSVLHYLFLLVRRLQINMIPSSLSMQGSGEGWVPHAMAKGAPCFPQPSPMVSKESIDAAIGDVLGKPWLPLPLGLKPPSLEGVLVELQRQGVSKVP